MPKNSAEYQREYRARKKAEAAASTPETIGKADTRPPGEIVNMIVSPTVKLPDVEAPMFPKMDREYGLPRSNYVSDHAAPGGWTETIRNADPHLVQKILDRVAPPRKMR